MTGSGHSQPPARVASTGQSASTRASAPSTVKKGTVKKQKAYKIIRLALDQGMGIDSGAGWA